MLDMVNTTKATGIACVLVCRMQIKQDAVGAYIWALLYYEYVKSFTVYYGCVSSAVVLYILGVSWDVWRGRRGLAR